MDGTGSPVRHACNAANSAIVGRMHAATRAAMRIARVDHRLITSSATPPTGVCNENTESQPDFRNHPEAGEGCESRKIDRDD